jgi:TIR domain
VPGRVIVEEMEAQIAKFDRVLLICSRLASQRPGWRFELEHAIQREKTAGTGSVLLPVSIDDCLDADSPWHQDPLLKTLCEQNVTPFQGTFDDSAEFNRSLGRILTALESDELPAPPAGSPPSAATAA